MEPIRRADIKPLPEYEKVRDASRREVIALKKARRVVLGECVSVVFENRRTVVHQIQEMMRAEHIYDEALILHEIETYNKLIPGAGELSATVFIEVDSPQAIQPTLDRLRGLDDGRSLVLRIDGVPPIYAVFEAGHSNEEKISAVHYVRFLLDAAAQRALREGAPAALASVHPRYQAETPLSEETRQQLLDDL
ncbi:MAG TPA: DUF3501 family protein [Nitrospiria bacterium]|nr:DUF3501 family protein [Nitrospiria bacterium]